ncbi:MAG: stage II sporulation protein D [Candidatus Heteroscillospira sp.]
MPRLLLTSILLLAAALFSPLLFLPRTAEPSALPTPAPAEETAPPHAVTDAGTALAVLGPDGVFDTDMEGYLVGAVAAEMPAAFHAEALQAQAVAIRTYILRACRMGNPTHPQADVCTDPGCCTAWLDEPALREKWGDAFEENFARVYAAVCGTDGQYLSYEGQPVQAVFHASSAGRTEDSAGVWSAVPYLVSVSSPETEENVKNLKTTVSLAPEQMRTLVLEKRPEAEFSPEPADWLGELVLTDTGRVAELTLCSETFTGTQLRACLGLRSTDFDAVYDGKNFVFTVRGYGHGVGMSQQGANLLAQSGMGWREILEHYYPGTELVSP